jgi:hypothetical protein
MCLHVFYEDAEQRNESLIVFDLKLEMVAAEGGTRVLVHGNGDPSHSIVTYFLLSSAQGFYPTRHGSHQSSPTLDPSVKLTIMRATSNVTQVGGKKVEIPICMGGGAP